MRLIHINGQRRLVKRQAAAAAAAVMAAAAALQTYETPETNLLHQQVT